MAQVYHTSAYLLLTRDLPGMDRIGIFYTRDYGKQSILLKAVKKPQSKLQSRLRERSLLEIEFILGRTLNRLIFVDEQDFYLDFREFYHKLTLQSLICELIDHLVDENDPDSELFEYILQVFSLIRSQGDRYPRIILGFMIIRLMNILGLGLHLAESVITGDGYVENSGISLQAGGLVEPVYRSEYPDFVSISFHDLDILRSWQRGEFVAEAVPWQIVQYYIKWYQLPIRSLKILDIGK